MRCAVRTMNRSGYRWPPDSAEGRLIRRLIPRDQRPERWFSVYLSELFVFGRVQICSGHRIDPTEMVMHQLDALDVFCRDDSGLAGVVLGDDAAQMYNAI